MAEKQQPEEFQLYNTMTKQKEKFKPKEPGKVSMYVCGVTSYDLSHIGHARAYVAFDVLYRYLKHLGYEVVYVRNFTDVDDKFELLPRDQVAMGLSCGNSSRMHKRGERRRIIDVTPRTQRIAGALIAPIIRRAADLGEDPLSLSARYCEEFLSDMSDLQCLPPTHQPRVSDHIDQIRDMIAQIISNDYAYPVDGDVYFSVDKFPNYGRLSGRKLEDNRAGERIAVDSRKWNPFDFALWKAAKPGEISWNSPWGPGRPGWHIECSAMSATYLTYTFDIHGGGMDLIFPHHENEIAQSCAACSESKISYWLHNGFVTANEEKMSKSLGNFFTIREVTKLYHPLALRHFLLGTHYRSAVNYSIAQIEISSDAVFYMYQTLQDCQDAVSLYHEGSQELTSSNGKTARITPAAQEYISKLRNEFESKMADDLHTPTLLKATLDEGFKLMNSSLNLLKKKQQKQKQLSILQSLVELEQEVKVVLNVLGLLSSFTYTEVLQQLKAKALTRAQMTEEGIVLLIEERALARQNKNFSRGDEIRSELSAKGIALMDVGKETVWRPCVPVEPQALPVERQAPPMLAAGEQS